MANLKGKSIEQVLKTNAIKVKDASSFLKRRKKWLVDRMVNSTKNLTFDRIEIDSLTKVTNVVDDLYCPPLEDESFQEFWENYFSYYFDELQIDITKPEALIKMMSDIYSFAQIKPWENNISIDDILEEEADKEFENV